MVKMLGFLYLICSLGLNAQDFGVWIATAHRIDFPKTNGKENQIKEIKSMIDEASDRGLTTVYIQIRARGDAFYQSKYEPWMESLSGRLGGNPGYDPLEIFIEYAKEKQIRVIGWFNVFKVADQSNTIKSVSSNKHPAEKHPSWILSSGSEKFLNPGIPDVREYISDVAKDVVANYDLDGIQLDFCRYPTTSFNDKKTELKYNKQKQTTSNWRRQNVTKTVELIRNKIKSVRENIVLSATPLGICKSVPNAKGLESYFEVYQDSYGWLENNLLDEIEPQIYWPIGNIPDGTGAKTSPDFTALSLDWQKNANGKLVRPGIALYKKPVLDQVDDIVSTALKNGNQGVVFYAWSQFKNSHIDLKKFQVHRKSDQLEPVSNPIKVEKLTSEQFLLHNPNKMIAAYDLLNEREDIISTGELSNQSVAMIKISNNVKLIRLYDSSRVVIGIIEPNKIK